MDKVYIIIEEYYDSEGYTRTKLFDWKFYTNEAQAKAAIEKEAERCREEWEDVPDLKIVELDKADV